MTRFGIRAASVAALVLTVLSGTHPTFAQDDATKQARDHYQKGMVYFQNGDYPNAVAELKQAYQIKRIPGLLFNIGQTYRKMDDTDMSIFYFDKFLKEAPPAAPQRAEAEKILGELRAKKNQGQVAVPPPLEETPQVAPQPMQPAPQPQPQRRRRVVDKFEHREVEEAPPSTPLDVRIQLPEGEGLRATLYYRTAGQDNYTAVAMRPRYDEWVGRVPGEMIVGKSFQYYVEARDASGNVIGKSGSAGAPNIVSIVDGAKPQFYADLGEGMEGQTEEAQPLPVVRKGKHRRRARTSEEEEGGEEEEPRTLHNLKTLKWWSTGVAGGLLVLGLVSELIAMSSASNVESMACKSPGCSAPNTFFNTDLQGSESTGQTFSTVGTISLIAGALAAGGAITFWVLDDSAEMEPEKRPGKPRRGLSLAPLIAPTPNGTVYGFAGGFRF